MQNQKIKNIIILLVVIIAGFLVFYYSSEPKESINNPENIEKQEEIVGPEKALPVISSSGNNTQTTSQEVSISKDYEKFTTAIKNANNAFLKADYDLSLKYYNEALTYRKDDGVYAGIYTIHLTQKNWVKALDAINQAIAISPIWGDYWKWKILVLHEGMNSNFTDIKNVYNEGFPKIKTEEKINIVTYVARIAEQKGEKSEAIALWQKAIEVNPDMKAVYQAEIDRLSK